MSDVIVMDLGPGDRFRHPHADSGDEYLLSNLEPVGGNAFRTAIRMHNGQACRFHPLAVIFPTLRLKED